MTRAPPRSRSTPARLHCPGDATATDPADLEPKPAEPPATKIVYVPGPLLNRRHRLPSSSRQRTSCSSRPAWAVRDASRFPLRWRERKNRPERKAAATPSGPGPGPLKTEVAFKPSTVVGGKAGPAIRLTYVMVPQLIPCALDTAMDSTLAGAISCHTTQDVLSPDHVLLMPTGTVVMGTYKNDLRLVKTGCMPSPGMRSRRKAFPCRWIPPLPTALGAQGSGRPIADVDHHYLERFGAALFYPSADAGVSLGQAELSRGNTTNLNFGSAGGGTGLPTSRQQILQSQINIPPYDLGAAGGYRFDCS